MPKVQYKHKKGALHIGGGRFFYAAEPVEVSDEEIDQLLETYEDLEEVAVDEPDQFHTPASLKKLNAEQQKEVISTLGGNPDETKNEEERIALILKLQDEAGE
ncbi:hypothetical protein [Domibacillus sp.]|uniref:hypothetical protein n=1 Tax=Domibacillus sp. TaxID=1969783 RepID=UPI002811608A|nr:hypothetical protein [Domibacillus sp.]